MKYIWIILSLVLGALFFYWGCMSNSDKIQFFGGLVLVPGIIGLCGKIWPEKEER